MPLSSEMFSVISLTISFLCLLYFLFMEYLLFHAYLQGFFSIFYLIGIFSCYSCFALLISDLFYQLTLQTVYWIFILAFLVLIFKSFFSFFLRLFSFRAFHSCFMDTLFFHNSLRIFIILLPVFFSFLSLLRVGLYISLYIRGFPQMSRDSWLPTH